MRRMIGKVLSVLVLSIAVSEAGAAREHAMDASASDQPSAMPANQEEPGQRTNTGLGFRVALQYGSTDTSEVDSRLPGTEIRPVPPIGAAKTSALVLSSLGMLSVVALLRLSRTL